MPTKPIGLEELETEHMERLERDLQLAFTNSLSAGAERNQMREGWRATYWGLLDEKPKAWMSNVDMRLAKYIVDSSAKKFSNAVFGSDPLCELQSRVPGGDDDAKEEQNYQQFWYDVIRLRVKGYLAILCSMRDGESYLWPEAKRTNKPEIKGASSKPITIDQLDVVPNLRVVEADDIMLLPFDAPNYALARGIFARTMMRWSDIISLSNSGQMYEDAVDRLKTKWQAGNTQTSKQQQQGVDTTQPNDIWDANFECWEGIYRWAKPGEDEEQVYLMTLYSPVLGGDTTAIVLKMTEYTQFYGDQWIPCPIITDPNPNSLHGNSAVGDLEGFHQWINATFNQCTDALTISIMPPRATGLSSKGKNLKYEPGAQWDVSPGDVQEIRSDPGVFRGIQVGMAMINDVRGMAARLKSADDTSIGKVVAGDKTKYEIGAVLQASDQMQEQHITSLQTGADEGQGFKAVYEMLFQITKQFLPKRPLMYRSPKSSSKDAFTTIDPKVHQGSYDFIPTGSSMSSSAQVKYAKAQATVQSVIASEFCMVSAQMEPVEVLEVMKRRWNAQAAYLAAIGNQHPETVLGGEPSDANEAMSAASIVFPQAVATIVARLDMLKRQQEQQSGGNPQPGMVPVAAGAPGGGGPGAGGTAPQGGSGGVPIPGGEQRMAAAVGAPRGNGAGMG
jgi:hypothetical protein